jgi:hypothetical protein
MRCGLGPFFREKAPLKVSSIRAKTARAVRTFFFLGNQFHYPLHPVRTLLTTVLSPKVDPGAASSYGRITPAQ